jgi:hypothetical protein
MQPVARAQWQLPSSSKRTQSFAESPQSQSTTAVGEGAVASPDTTPSGAASLGTSVADGNLAMATSEDAVAIGDQAVASVFHSTAVGGEAIAGGTGAQTFGWRASGAGNLSLAARHQANASALQSTAVGKNANAGFSGSTAVGFAATTTRANQVVMGGAGTVSWHTQCRVRKANPRLCARTAGTRHTSTTSRITSGEELKYSNGLGGLARDLRCIGRR